MNRKVNVFKDVSRASPWQVMWRQAGKQYRRSFPNKAQADEYANHIRNRLQRHYMDLPTSLHWLEFVKLFLQDRQLNRIAPTTIKIYRQALDGFEDANGPTETDQITMKHVDAYKASISGKNPVTINKLLRHLSATFTWAVKRKYMIDNPVPNAGKLREPKIQKMVWTPKQFEKVIESCYDPQWKILIHLAVNGVARKSSLMRLKISDVDIEKGTVSVWDEKQKQYSHAPIHENTLSLLVDHINSLPDGQEKLFTSKFHHSTWDRIIKTANVPRIKFHDLRTCMSTWLKESGVADGVVTAILGHSSPTVTTKHYTALDNEKSKRIGIDKLPL